MATDKERYHKNKQASIEYIKLFRDGQIELAPISEYKLCKGCGLNKLANIDNFYLPLIKLINGKYVPYFNWICIECETLRGKKKGKLYNTKEFEKETGMRKCRKCDFTGLLNADNFRFVQEKYFRRICLRCDREEANTDTKRRLVEDRESIRVSKRKYQTNRRKRDPVYKIRKYVSTSIYQLLKRQGGNKRGKSVMDFLPYIIGDLVHHIEQQFKLSGNEWMNWNNIGKYNSKTWNDNDPLTWKWNLDHIVPQAQLPYDNMEHPNFKKCWALNNLRPYSAKLNVIEGDRRVKL